MCGLGKMLGYYGIGTGKAAATYSGGPLGTIVSSYVGDALNSLLDNGTIKDYDPALTTQNLLVEVAVGQIGIGNSIGDVVSKKIGNEFIKNATKQIIAQNVDGLISDVGLRTWQTGSLTEGLKTGWGDYTKRGGWWKYSLSGAGQGYLDTYDSKTIARNETREAMKEYSRKNKSLSGFTYPSQPGSWMESMYYNQMKVNSQFNLRLYSPTRNFFNSTLPRWYYPEIYNY